MTTEVHESVVRLLKQGAYDAQQDHKNKLAHEKGIDTRTKPLMDALALAATWIDRHKTVLNGPINFHFKDDGNHYHSLRLYVAGASSWTLYNDNEVLAGDAFDMTKVRDEVGLRSSVNIGYTITEIGRSLTQYALEHDLPLPEFD